MDFGNWADAATEVGNSINELAETDLAWGFIYWVAETFGPNIPQPEDPPEEEGPGDEGPGGSEAPDDGDEEEEQSSAILSVADTASVRAVVSDPLVVLGLRSALDPAEEGELFDVDGTEFELLYKRENDPDTPGEFLTVVAPSAPLTDGKRRAIVVRAKAGKLYISSPK